VVNVTLQTVADAAGVSRSTVSNAYSRPDQLSTGLRERILETARHLGYPGPNPSARSLRRGRVGAIGVLFTESLPYAFTDPFAVGFLRGISGAAEQRETGLLLVPLAGDQSAALHAVQNAAVDGFCVYCLPDRHWAMAAIRSRGLPIVTSEEFAEVPTGTLFVGIDERGAARSAADHLVALGHRRVAVMSDYLSLDRFNGPVPLASPDDVGYFTSRERLGGFAAAFAAVGVGWSDITVLSTAANSRTDGFAAASSVLGDADRPTAILACTDMLALGAMDAARALGLTPGADISITGFDDIDEAAIAGLTTVRQSPVDRGRISGELLLDPPIDPASRKVLLPTELVIRASTGPVQRS
jgi:DNA-binding LacI/PurR family transcriptional regulator